MKFRITSPIFLLGVLAFLLSGMPKVRWVVGAPIYLVDIIILYLALATSGVKAPKRTGLAGRLRQIIGIYFVFVILGELRGALVYGETVDSLYMLFRFSLALMLPFIIPKVVRSGRELTVMVKGLCAGLSLSALLSILYSLPFTRGLTGLLFSIDFINPVDKSAGLASGTTLRGETLIGTSTFSSGLMAMLWPLLYMGWPLFNRWNKWRLWGKYSLVLLPFGILATYGRSAWLSVVLVFSSMLLWGSAKGKAQTAFWVIAAALVVVQVGIESDLVMVDRIIAKTQKTIEAPLESDSERERFLSYVEPFQHVVRYPSFLIAGSGATNRKFGGNAYKEAETASHAIPAMAYYAYGVGGSICQILMMVTAFRLINRRRVQAQQVLPSMVWMWRALLAAWFGLLPWFLFAHGLVTQPRGAMAYFLYIGIVLACEGIYLREERTARER